jgi:putative FmdB family regulatory protein
MPVYEYECTKGHQFEVEQRISEPPLERCRICRAKARRLISASTFILKGGGWYADGYGSGKGAAKSNGSSDSSGSGSSSTSSSTSDSSSKSTSTKTSSSGSSTD